LKKTPTAPSIEEMKQIINAVFVKTNQSLLDCDINTELSGSTVVAIFIYEQKIISFNVGDSRAIIVKQLHKDEQSSENSYSKHMTEKSKDYSNGFHSNRPRHYDWKVVPLSNDQKPERPDERERILQAGGRVFCQTT
jgi:serine/threonine protein phosphatase PrpC